MELTLKVGKRLVSVSPLGCAALSLLVLFALGVSALALLHFSKMPVGSEGIEFGTPVSALYTQREKMQNNALAELSKRIAAAGHHGKYNLPSAPWLTECAKFYTRSEFEQENIVKKVQQQEERWQAQKSEEQERFVKELAEVLPKHENAWLPALHAWLLPELDRLNFKPRPVSLDCTKHVVVLVQEHGVANIVWTVRNTFFLLDSDLQKWGLILFHGPDNGEELADAFEIHPGGAGEHIQLQLLVQAQQPHNAEASSTTSQAPAASSIPLARLLLSSAFWTLIPAEHVLLLPTDAIMLRSPASDDRGWKALTNEYALVGAPISEGSSPATLGVKELSSLLHSGGPMLLRKSFFLDLARSFRCTQQKDKVGECALEGLKPLGAASLHAKQLDLAVSKQSFPTHEQRLEFAAVDKPTHKHPWFARNVWHDQNAQQQQLPEQTAVFSLLGPLKIRYVDP